jgi:hypothetical protein
MTALERSGRDRSLAAAVPGTIDPLPAPAEPAGVTQRRRVRRRPWLAAIAGVVVLPLVVAAGLTWSWGTGARSDADIAAARVVSAADMESEYGIEVNLVAVTMAGGMVDVRFTVLDQAKAEAILHDDVILPVLLVEPSGAVIRAPTGHRHKTAIVDGGKYFLLYGNPGGAIQAGTKVSVVIGDVRLAPIDAQS